MIQDDLKDLYQEMIVDHSRHPRNCRKIEHPTCAAAGNNPLCGDQLTLYVQLEGDRIRDLSFEGKGCAISMASASMMTEYLKNRTKQEALNHFEKFHQLVTEDGSASTLSDSDLELLGKLRVFSGVSEFPSRVKCASLAWHTLVNALRGNGEIATTESGTEVVASGQGDHS
ncbi:SUF system NifU family Fe-S cluster assembly protein [bacterium]|nr:SUF system NifU family Fe-S cluster assembly protein [bacterium]